MEKKEQFVFENSSTRVIAFYSRLVNFIEDLIDDAYCKTVYVSGLEDSDGNITIEPVECLYDFHESIELFSNEWNIDNVVLGKGVHDYRILYSLVKDKYLETLHYIMKNYASKTYVSRKEYFLAVTFTGKAIVLEGEPEKVRIPLFNQCFSAHTHPSARAIPSKHDLVTIMNIMLNRGIGHAIETPSETLVIYRTAPLTEEDILVLRRIEREDSLENIIRMLRSIPRIEMSYVR